MPNMGMTVQENIRFFLIVFVFTLLLGIFVRQLLLPYLLPAMHAGSGFMTGDSIGYHEFATEIAKRIHAEGWSVWQLRPGSEIFTLATPSGIASAIYAAFGTNPLFLLPFNAAVHAASAVLLLVMMQALFENKRVALLATLPFVLFPTAISWHSQLLKDGIFILGIYAYLTSWILLAKMNVSVSWRLADLLVLASLGLITVWVVRPYMLVVLVSTTIVLGLFLLLWVTLQRSDPHRCRMRIAAALVFLVGLLAIAFGVNKADSGPKMNEWAGQVVKSNLHITVPPENSAAKDVLTNRENSLRTCQGWKDPGYVPIALGRLALKIVTVRGGYYDSVYTSAGSTVDRDICITSFHRLVAYMPRATQLGLFAPFPDQWIKSGSHGGGASQLLVGLEMLVSYVALFLLICCGRRFFNRPEFWMLLGFSLFMIVLYALVTPNLGALHRMRYGFLMLLVGMGLGLGLVRFRLRKTQA